MTDQIKGPFRGVFAAVLTPLNANGSPDLGRMTAHCQWLLANGCDGLGVLGTTGEANSFTIEERIAIVEGLVERGVPAETMMPGTGCCAVGDTVTLTRAALDAGAPGVLMLPPFYYKNQSDEGLYRSVSEAIEDVGDDRLNVYLYHFPQMSGVPVTMGLIDLLTKAYPDTVVGMKDSSGEFDNMVEAIERFPGFAVFSGADDLLLPVLKRGGAGCITACANVASALAGDVYAAFQAEGDGPRAEAAQEPLTAVRKTIYTYPLSPALKALVARHRVDDGWRQVRAPMLELDAAMQSRLFQAFDALGVALPEAA